MGFRKEGYIKRNKQQLEDWLIGISNHNKIDDECCPDFSCCIPELLAQKEERQKFYDATINNDYKIIDKMLGNFLSWMVAREVPLKKIYITGDFNER